MALDGFNSTLNEGFEISKVSEILLTKTPELNINEGVEVIDESAKGIDEIIKLSFNPPDLFNVTELILENFPLPEIIEFPVSINFNDNL